MEELSTIGVGNLGLPLFIILLSYDIHKDKEMKSWIDPTFYFLERRTHPMAKGDKAKNVRIIVRQLPTKAAS